MIKRQGIEGTLNTYDVHASVFFPMSTQKTSACDNSVMLVLVNFVQHVRKYVCVLQKRMGLPFTFDIHKYTSYLLPNATKQCYR